MTEALIMEEDVEASETQTASTKDLMPDKAKLKLLTRYGYVVQSYLVCSKPMTAFKKDLN